MSDPNAHLDLTRYKPVKYPGGWAWYGAAQVRQTNVVPEDWFARLEGFLYPDRADGPHRFYATEEEAIAALKEAKRKAFFAAMDRLAELEKQNQKEDDDDGFCIGSPR